VILLLIVLVAAFNIVSTLTMVVADKTKEIGILKAMGMPARSIRRIFFAQGLVIGVVGTALGLVLGLVPRSPSTNTSSSSSTRSLFHRPPAGLDAADGCHVDHHRQHCHRRDRNGVSVGAGFETLPDRSDQARMTMTVLEAHDVYKTIHRRRRERAPRAEWRESLRSAR